MIGSPRRRSTRLTAVFASLILGLTAAAPLSSAQSILGGAPSSGVASTNVTTPAPEPTTPAARCMPVGFSAGWELAFDNRSNIDRTMQEARAAGASHYRFAIDWSYVEPSRGSFDWSKPDAVIRSASAHGIKIVAILAYTPTWARAADGDRDSSQTRPANPSDFAAFSRAAAARYGQVSDFEIWNEPNLVQFFKPAPNPAQYTDLLKTAYPAIKSVRPDANVMAGALAASGWDGGNITGPDFTTRMYAAGARGSFDSMSFHPYNYPERLGGTRWNTLGMADQMYSTMQANGDGGKKIWFTEFGAPTGQGSRASSEQGQAEILSSGVATSTGRSYVGGYLAYTLKDYGTNVYDAEQNFGLLRNDFSRKAGFATVAAALSKYRC